jgi:hypothetical protein
MAVFLLGMAALIHFESRAVDALRDVRVGALEQGARPPGRWVRLHGLADLDRAVRHGRGEADREYVPIVSALDHNPVAAVLVLSQRQSDDDVLSEPGAGANGFEAFSSSGVLDKEVREAFREEGTEVAEDAVVVEYKLTPREFGRRAVPAMWMGMALGVIIGVLQGVARISDRRRARVAP